MVLASKRMSISYQTISFYSYAASMRTEDKGKQSNLQLTKEERKTQDAFI